MSESKWNWKTWMVGVLVALGVASTWAANKLANNSQEVPTDRWDVGCASAHVIFEQKKRCGFIDLGELVEVEGCVTRAKIHGDGDLSIKLKLTEEYEHLLYYEGRKTQTQLKAEFMPCERLYEDVESVLQEVLVHTRSDEFKPDECSMKVKLTGRWAYDGVDHRGEWRDQLGKCLNGRGVDPNLGWTEIHPAYTVEILK